MRSISCRRCLRLRYTLLPLTYKYVTIICRCRRFATLCTTHRLVTTNREFWPAVRGSWVVSFCFCPLQFLTFRYLPLEFRVLSVNLCDIAWTSVLSYFSHKAPPEEEEASRTDDRGARKRAIARRERTKNKTSAGRNGSNSLNRRKASGSGANDRARDSKHPIGARA